MRGCEQARRDLADATIRVVLLCILLMQGVAAAGEETLRDQRSVTLAGAQETWRLVWEGKTGTVCGPEDINWAVTCPCSGWAYAEYGKLVLVRSRGGYEVERMDLRPLFDRREDGPPGAEGSALLQRWPLQDGDWENTDSSDPGIVAEIKRRPAPSIINMADYARDGASAAFLIQVDTEPCGKHQYAAVGITKAVPHLHALTSALHPERPLIMPQAAWQALLTSPGPTVIETWACEDHGLDERLELVVSSNGGAIHVKGRDYSCPSPGKPQRLLSETAQ